VSESPPVMVVPALVRLAEAHTHSTNHCMESEGRSRPRVNPTSWSPVLSHKIWYDDKDSKEDSRRETGFKKSDTDPEPGDREMERLRSTVRKEMERRWRLYHLSLRVDGCSA
jgi:hypothetical protein